MTPHTCTGDPSCFGCRVKTVQFGHITAFQPHFNYSVGAYVETEQQFVDTLKRRAEENTLATGTEHHYEMRDPAELARNVPYPDHDDILNTQGRMIADRYGD